MHTLHTAHLPHTCTFHKNLNFKKCAPSLPDNWGMSGDVFRCPSVQLSKTAGAESAPPENTVVTLKSINLPKADHEHRKRRVNDEMS